MTQAASWLKLSSPQQELLKWAAVATMTLDHANRALWPYQNWAFALGQLAFALFVFLLAYNTTARAVSPRRYLLPLLVFGMLSQPLAMIFFDRGWLPLNILFTLLLGVTFLGGLEALKQRFWEPLAWSLALVVWGGLSLLVEYGPMGVFLVPATQTFLQRPTSLRAAPMRSLLLAANLFVPASFAPLLLPLLIWSVSQVSVTRLRRSRWLYVLSASSHAAVTVRARALRRSGHAQISPERI